MRITRVIKICAATGALAICAPTGVSAAGFHDISGTVYEGGGWYRSPETRFVGSTTDIIIDLDKLPAGSDGVQWVLNDAKSSSHAAIGSFLHINDGSAHVIARSVRGGTAFQNNFKQWNSAKGTGDYTFYGRQYY